MAFLALLGVVWAASWLLVPASGLWLSGGGAFVLLAVAVAVFGAGECLHGAVQAPLVADLADHSMLGRYMAISALSWQVGFTIGPAVGARSARRLADRALDRVPRSAVCSRGAGALALERGLPEGVRRTPHVPTPSVLRWRSSMRPRPSSSRAGYNRRDADAR